MTSTEELFQPIEPPDHEAHRGGKPPKVKISKRLPRKVYPTAVPGISLTNYKVGPSGKGWGAHCTGNRTTITLSNGVRITVRSEIAELSTLLLNECIRRGYVIRQVDTGAYNCRLIAGSSTWSNHAWALAIDINWQLNPMRRPLTTNIPVWMRQLFNRFGFAWGGDYSGTPDAMHMEFMGTPAQADAATQIARRELGGAAPAPAEPWLNLPDVRTTPRKFQAWYNAFPFNPPLLPVIKPLADSWGPQSEAALKKVQSRYGLTADGIVGPRTKKLLWDLGWRG
jgi:hypothetical protein